MRRWLIVSRDDHGVAHDGSAGVSPEGWLPDRVSVGALTRTFPPELVDRVVAATDTRELRRRLLPARLVVYFVLALWLFRGSHRSWMLMAITSTPTTSRAQIPPTTENRPPSGRRRWERTPSSRWSTGLPPLMTTMPAT